MSSPPTLLSRLIGVLRVAVVLVFGVLMRLLVLLPFRLQLKVCKAGGLLAYYLLGSRRRVVLTNLRLCFPELSAAERERLARAHFRALGAFMAETAMSWYGSIARLERMITIEGRDHLEAALARRRGVILFTAHFTTFELYWPVFAPLCPRFSGMQKLQSNPVMNRLMTQGRSRSTSALIDKNDVRGMLRELKANAAFWYAADQSYSSKGAALIPFFGVPAMTTTAISRIARSSGAAVLPLLPRRKADDSGYVLAIGPPLDGFPSDDAEEDTRRLIAILEAFIRTCPEQYWWIHKRFKSRPPPLPDVYAQAG